MHYDRLVDRIGGRIGGMTIVDVGAYSVAGQEEAYAPLLALPGATVIGFEPNVEECERLNALRVANRCYYPHAVGDGSKGRFFNCRWPLTSSLLRPNARLLERYEDLGELCKVVSIQEIVTKRLDDIDGLREVDILKIDAQGAALEVLRGASRLLAHTLVVHVETEFVPLYEGEALFSDVERWLRHNGFMFHHFFQMEGRRIRAGDLVVGKRSFQTLWADAVFVPEFERLERLAPNGFLKLATIMDSMYGAHDLALLCLTYHDRATGAGVSREYLDLLRGTGGLA